jgi:hypothetical protein
MTNEEFENQRSLENAKAIRQALGNADSILKFHFKQFCIQNSIAPSYPEWGFIPREEDVKIIKESLEASLKKHNIDIRTVETIPTDVFNEITKDAKEALQRFLNMEVQKRALEDLLKLMEYDKPIAWVNTASLRQDYYKMLNKGDPESIVKTKRYLEVNKGAVGQIVELCAAVTPLHMANRSQSAQDQRMVMPNVEVKEVLKLGKIDFAIVTNDAVFVQHWNPVYMDAMANGYRAILNNRGIQFPEISGIAGFNAMLSYSASRGPALSEKINVAGMTDEEKYQILTEYINQMQSNGEYEALHLQEHSNLVLAKNDAGHSEILFDDVYPGMEIRCCYYSFEEMNTGNTIEADGHFYVMDVVKIGEDTILVTDRGIIANRDLSQELELSSREHDARTRD